MGGGIDEAGVYIAYLTTEEMPRNDDGTVDYEELRFLAVSVNSPFPDSVGGRRHAEYECVANFPAVHGFFQNKDHFYLLRVLAVPNEGEQ